MTDILFQRFRERFPSINDYERITIYGAYERIYLDLIEAEFISSPLFDSKEKIKDLALKIFDVNFIYKFLRDGLDERVGIIFDPIILPKPKMSYESFRRNMNYSGHSIEITLPASHPMITISTGNRGAVDLIEKQRDNYYNFVVEVYEIFLGNAKKNEDKVD
jgi:hypothetical protein